MYVCIVVQRIRRAASTGAARSLPKNPKVNLAYRGPRNVYHDYAFRRLVIHCVYIYIYITYLRIDLHIYIYIRIYFHVCRCPPVQTLASPILPIAGFMPFSIEARSLDFKKKSKAMIFPSPPLKSIIHPIIGIVVGKMISNFRISRLIEKINPAPLEIPSRLIKSTCIKFWKIKKRKRKMSGRGRTRRRELILVNLSSSILHSRGEHREGEQGKPMPLGAQWRASSFCTPVCSSFR